MRFLILSSMVLVALSGCTLSPDEVQPPTGSCPAWVGTPDGLGGQAGVDFIHDGTSDNEEFRQENKAYRVVFHPGTLYEHEEYGRYANSNGDVQDAFDIMLDVGWGWNNTHQSMTTGIVDAVIRLQVWAADYDEYGGPLKNMDDPPEPGELPTHTGRQLRFIETLPDQSRVRHTTLVVPVGEILHKSYRIELTDGTGPVDPNSLRLDAYFDGNHDDDDATPSVASIHVDGQRWLRQAHCI